MAQISPEDPAADAKEEQDQQECTSSSIPQRRPNRRLNNTCTEKAAIGTPSSLHSCPNSSVMSADAAIGSSITSASLTSSQTSRQFYSSLRDKRGLAASTGGSVKISFIEPGGLDNVSMRSILAGLETDSEDDSSVDSYLEELKCKQKAKDEDGRRVKFQEFGLDKLSVNESEGSMHVHASGV